MSTAELKEQLTEFVEMLESDKAAIEKGCQHLPTHEIIGNYISDLMEIIEKIE